MRKWAIDFGSECNGSDRFWKLGFVLSARILKIRKKLMGTFYALEGIDPVLVAPISRTGLWIAFTPTFTG
jgi:hypothetical protein